MNGRRALARWTLTIFSGTFFEMRLRDAANFKSASLGNFLLRKFDQASIEIGVMTCRIAPRHVGRRAVALNPPPGRHVVKRGAGLLEDTSKIFGGDRSKLEPGLSAAVEN